VRHGWLYGQLQGVVWVAAAHHKHFCDVFPQQAAKSHHVPNGIDLDDWQPVAAGERARTVVFAGRLAREKGVVELAEALARFLPKHPDWSAQILAVTTPERAETEAAVRADLDPFGARVIWSFDQPLDRVREVFIRAGVVIVPSIVVEGFNRVAMEAHAAGAAVISSGSGGLREVSGDAAIYLRRVSADEISTALDRLADPRALTEWQRRSRAHAVESLALDRVTARLDDILERIAKAGADQA
jgi:glycosyltransferase involved in cell wall biosynthesis